MIALKEWSNVESFVEKKYPLQSFKDCDSCCSEKSCSASNFQNKSVESHSSILHCACTYPEIPLSTVVAILRTCPNALRETDHDGRLPLHRATRNGVGSDVVRYLLERYPEAAVRRDNKGKTPLHLACKYFSIVFDNSGTRFKYRKDKFAHMCKTLKAVIIMFLRADPDCFLLDDDKGMSALEYAIDGEVIFETVFMMQTAIECLQKNKSLNSSQDGKEELWVTLQHEGFLAGVPEGKILITE